MLRILLGTSTLAALSLLATPAMANEEDANIWLAQTSTINLGDDMTLWLEAQERFTNDASRLGQLLIRPAIGYKLDATTTVSLGYAYVHTDPAGPAESDEHRIWQQLSYRLAGDGKGVTLTGRSRLEQRWVEGAPDMGWRFRQQLRLTAPLAGRVRAFASSEAFFALDDTSWGQTGGFDRWRNSAGLAVPVGRSITVEPGYTNQWIPRVGQDRVHHIANINISTKF